MPTPEQLAGYDADEFASNIKSILLAVAQAEFGDQTKSPEIIKNEEFLNVQRNRRLQR